MTRTPILASNIPSLNTILTGSPNLSHLFANRFPPVPALFITSLSFFSHILRILYTN